MAPLPNNNTPTYYVDYTANGRAHTAQFRYNEPVDGPPPNAPFIARVATLFADLAPALPTDFAITGARYRAKGGDVSLAASAPAPLTPPSGTPSPGEAPAFLSFVGRSALGRRCRLYILGVTVSAASEGGIFGNYRISRGESTTFDAALTNIQGAGFVAVDGSPVVWYDYINIGYNAHWQKRARR